MIWPGLDLNLEPTFCHPARNALAGGLDAHRQVGFRAGHRTSAVDHVSPLRGTLRWKSQGQKLFLSRSVSLHGIRPTDLSRKLARYRSVSARPTEQTLSHGDQPS